MRSSALQNDNELLTPWIATTDAEVLILLLYMTNGAIQFLSFFCFSLFEIFAISVLSWNTLWMLKIFFLFGVFPRCSNQFYFLFSILFLWISFTLQKTNSFISFHLIWTKRPYLLQSVRTASATSSSLLVAKFVCYRTTPF